MEIANTSTRFVDGLRQKLKGLNEFWKEIALYELLLTPISLKLSAMKREFGKSVFLISLNYAQELLARDGDYQIVKSRMDG